MHRFRFHPAARAEYENTYNWYGDVSAGAAIDFILRIDHALSLIRQFPHSGSPYMFGTRRFVLRTFPYTVIYRIKESEIQIIAVAHEKRRPGYWKHRVPKI